MVPRVGAQYALKKISDYVMAPPAQEEPGEVEPAAPARPPVVANIDGQTINDEQGQPLGTARLVANIAVYLVTDQRRGLGEQLQQIVGDPETRVYVHHDEQGQLAGLIYVPDPSKRPAAVAATRPDDI